MDTRIVVFRSVQGRNWTSRAVRGMPTTDEFDINIVSFVMLNDIVCSGVMLKYERVVAEQRGGGE